MGGDEEDAGGDAEFAGSIIKEVERQRRIAAVDCRALCRDDRIEIGRGNGAGAGNAMAVPGAGQVLDALLRPGRAQAINALAQEKE